MLRDIRECFRGDVVGRDLDSIGRPLLMTHVELHGNGRAEGERLERGGQAALAQDGWMDPARHLPKLVDDARHAIGEATHLLP